MHLDSALAWRASYCVVEVVQDLELSGPLSAVSVFGVHPPVYPLWIVVAVFEFEFEQVVDVFFHGMSVLSRRAPEDEDPMAVLRRRP